MLEFALGAFVPAMLLSLLLTPLAGRLAARAGLVAEVRPDRLHRRPRPYGGGIAVVLSAALALAVAAVAMPTIEDEPAAADAALLGRLGGGAVPFFLLGLVDDKFRLAAWWKLPLQFACATVAVLGLGFQAAAWLPCEALAQAASILWLLAVINAYNLLDHADGVAAAWGAMALAALACGQAAISAEVCTRTLTAAPALAAAGALAGFLVHNRPPARLFMGDAGTMCVGYLLAALTMAGRYFFSGFTPSRWVVLVPLAILAVPLADMVFVVAARLRRGRNPFRGDAENHLAHRMLARGWSPRGVVAFAAGASAVTGAASVAMYSLSGPALVIPWLAVAAVLAAMLLVRRPPDMRGGSGDPPRGGSPEPPRAEAAT
ncbi:MAG: undecaprenyl/decaprenyl-phosphate alpha-N-acetylglucosaminyl 1-phosphate transferase [Planctomycetes bacterium]|nr:undecaprenyl/decaprenyl-phosphate alpha-N-acetylglucosaminyl 1-phosphate transferase [Planctomycetota bacterium]